MTDATLVREKLDQAPAILEEQGIDLWLTLVRETLLTRDPCLDLIAGTYCAWQSAFLVSRSGERIAIVGRYDASSVEQLGAYSEVVKYDESIRPGLRETIERLAPETIAINYSPSDPAADGLTHGLWLVLRETLGGHAVRRSTRLVETHRRVAARAQVAVRDRSDPRRDRRDGRDLRARRETASGPG